MAAEKVSLAIPILEILKLWSSTDEYDGKTLENFLSEVSSELVTGTNQPPSELSEMKGALLTLFVEAARHSLNPKELLQFCKSTLFIDNKETLDSIEASYSKIEKRINFYLLQTTSTTLPHITGMSVKLLYESSTTEAGRSGELIYLVKMEVEDPGCKSPRSLEMLCRDHELQDLLAKLTDALKSIQKLTVQSMPSWAKLFKK